MIMDQSYFFTMRNPESQIYHGKIGEMGYSREGGEMGHTVVHTDGRGECKALGGDQIS